MLRTTAICCMDWLWI